MVLASMTATWTMGCNDSSIQAGRKGQRYDTMVPKDKNSTNDTQATLRSETGLSSCSTGARGFEIARFTDDKIFYRNSLENSMPYSKLSYSPPLMKFELHILMLEFEHYTYLRF